VRKDGLFDNLTFFFALFEQSPSVAELKQLFLSSVDSNNTTNCSTADLRSMYERAVTALEKKAALYCFGDDLLKLQRDLYSELEYLLSSGDEDTRHHFFLVIPVADRPVMLKNCLDSLIEQCRIFKYGGVMMDKNGTPYYNKITLLIIDDSSDAANILKSRELASQMWKAGIRTLYVGLEEQTAFLDQLPPDLKEQSIGLIGGPHNPVLPHKGASVTRNITYLYIHTLLKNFREKALIYFLDSDEEFRVRVRRAGSPADIPFINYFYWIDRIFESSGNEIITGKVVGDPPVTPSVMINTFLDDLTLFFDIAATSSATDECPFHELQQSGSFSAEYHDMARLFGYQSPSAPKKYNCTFAGCHSVKDSFRDFSRKVIGFFYGLHPTRTQYYDCVSDFLKTEKARTVYTGNYVVNREGLRHFIPFADLKLRMGGPTLGRILQSKIKGRFSSVNLPLLHKRTISGTNRDEFRSGVFEDRDTLDLSSEFFRQFWGDVMLFSVETLVASGYPVRYQEFQQIVEVVFKTQNDLWSLYRNKQAKTDKMLSKIRNYLSDSKYWWNSLPEMKDSLNNFRRFCSLAERNFGLKSESCKILSEQIKEDSYINLIIDAIHAYCEDDHLWDELLGRELILPPIGAYPTAL
jgi:hypothetical protein